MTVTAVHFTAGLEEDLVFPKVHKKRLPLFDLFTAALVHLLIEWCDSFIAFSTIVQLGLCQTVDDMYNVSYMYMLQ